MSKSLIRSLALILALQPVLAGAQQFPTVPPNTVIGRLGNGIAGPSQAIPFATLAAQIGAVTATRNINTTSPLAGGGSLAGDRTLSINTNGISNTLIRQSGPLAIVGNSTNATANVADISAVANSSCAFIESASTIICGQLATAGIANNAVDNTKFRQSSALSLVGRSANSTGNVADIAATAGSSCVFMESSSSVACGAITTASIAANTVTFAKFQTIAALSMFGNCTNATANGAAVTGTANQVLRVNGAGTSCGFGAIDLSQVTAATGTLQTASVPAFAGGDVTGAGGSLVLTIGANAVTNAKMATMAANTVKGNATGGSAVPTDVAPATARSSSLLNVDSFTGHGDSIYTILATDRTVGTNAAFTASRTWTLPAANAVNPGQEIVVADFQGTVTGTNTLVILRAGADTVNGVTSATIASANGAYLLKSDGTSKWTAQALGSAAAGGVSSVTCGTGLSGGTITTSGTCALALTNATLQANPTNPTGCATATCPLATGVMMGMGTTCKLTPVYSSRVHVTFYNGVANATSGSNNEIKLFFGTGTAPANAAAATGTQIANLQRFVNNGANFIGELSNGGIVTGLTPGTAYWFDESLGSDSGTVSLSNVSCSIDEF